MEETSYNNILEYKHIEHSTNEILKYIKQRKNREVKSLRTRWKKFNDQCMGGIEPNTIYTIAGKRHMPALNS